MKCILGWLGLLLLLGSCNRATTPTAPPTQQAEKTATLYATHLAVEPVGDSLFITLYTPTAAGTDTLRLQLPRHPAPARCVAISTTQTAMFEALGVTDQLVGIGQADYLYSPTLHSLVAKGRLIAVAPGGELNTETVLSLGPTYLLLAGGEADAAHLQALRDAGITVLPNSDWLEPHPLGRAEWLLLVGALTGRYDQAEAYLQTVRHTYDSLAVLARAATPRPVVVGGAPYNDVWYVPGGRSYLARLLQDAGAAYPWASDTSTGSLALALETVLPIALEADIWLNPGQVPTQQDVEARHPILRTCKPLRNHRLYGYYARVTPEGGNDYFERGALEPHIVLKDLVKLFHPDLVPEHSWVYYRHLP